MSVYKRYVIEHFKNFDPVGFFKHFDFTYAAKEPANEKLKTPIRNLARTNYDAELRQWAQEQVDDDFLFLATNRVEAFWASLIQDETERPANETGNLVINMYSERTYWEAQNRKRRIAEEDTTEQVTTEIVEKDGVYIPDFGDLSIGTILQRRSAQAQGKRSCAIVLGLNGVLDLSDASKEGQRRVLGASDDQWQTLKETWPVRFKVPAFDDLTRQCAETIADEAQESFENALDMGKGVVGKYGRKADEKISFLLEMINTRYIQGSLYNFDDAKLLTEAHYTIMYWSPTLFNVFQNTHLVLRLEDSVLKEENIYGQEHDNAAKFKVHLRIIYRTQGADYDVGACEFAKDRSRQTKIISDHAKLVLEAKTIIKQMICKANVSKEDVLSTSVIALQTAGLDINMIEVKLVASGLYVSNKLVRTTKKTRVMRKTLQDFKNVTAAYNALMSLKTQALRNKSFIESGISRKRRKKVESEKAFAWISAKIGTQSRTFERELQRIKAFPNTGK